MRPELLQKLQLTVGSPGFYNALKPDEQAELFLYLLAAKNKKIKLKDGKDGVDGKTPVADKDYLSKKSTEKIIKDAFSSKEKQIDKIVKAKLATLKQGKDGKDAEITPEQIEDIVQESVSRITIPEYTPFDDAEIRELIENHSLDHEQLRDEVETLKNTLPQTLIGGGAQTNWVKKYVKEQIDSIPTSTNTWSYYAMNWSVEPSLNSSITGGDVYDYTLDGTTRYRFVPTTYDPTQDAFYSNFSGGTLSGLIVSRG